MTRRPRRNIRSGIPTSGASLVLLIIVASSSATAASPLRAVVRSTVEADHVFEQRLTGQVTDLDVDVVSDPSAIPPSLAGQFSDADRVGRQYRAQSVIWISRSREGDGRWMLCIAQPGIGRVVLRALGNAPFDARAESTMLESAALMARSAFEAFLAEDTVDLEHPPSDARPPSFPAPFPPRGPRARAGTEWIGQVGWEATFIGAGGSLASGLVVAVAHATSHFELGFRASVGIASEVILDSATRVTLARHSGAAQAAWRPFEGGTWIPFLGLGIGLVMFDRTTTSTLSTVAGTPPHISISPTLRAFGGMSIRLGSSPGSPLSLGITAGLDGILAPPEMGISDTHGHFYAVRSLNAWQPWIALTLALSTPLSGRSQSVRGE